MTRQAHLQVVPGSSVRVAALEECSPIAETAWYQKNRETAFSPRSVALAPLLVVEAKGESRGDRACDQAYPRRRDCYQPDDAVPHSAGLRRALRVEYALGDLHDEVPAKQGRAE